MHRGTIKFVCNERENRFMDLDLESMATNLSRPRKYPNVARFIRCHLGYSVRYGNPYIGEYEKVWIINRNMRNKVEKYINH